MVLLRVLPLPFRVFFLFFLIFKEFQNSLQRPAQRDSQQQQRHPDVIASLEPALLAASDISLLGILFHGPEADHTLQSLHRSSRRSTFSPNKGTKTEKQTQACISRTRPRPSTRRPDLQSALFESTSRVLCNSNAESEIETSSLEEARWTALYSTSLNTQPGICIFGHVFLGHTRCAFYSQAAHR